MPGLDEVGSLSRRRLIARTIAFAAPGAILGGCSSDPPRPKTTALKVVIDADREINLDPAGQANPLVLRIYELKTLSAFEQAGFFDLLDNDSGKLGPDLVSRREFELRPGDKRNYNRRAPAEARHLGVIAGFRNLDAASWRSSADIVEDRINSFAVTVTALKVDITLLKTERDFDDWF